MYNNNYACVVKEKYKSVIVSIPDKHCVYVYTIHYQMQTSLLTNGTSD